MMRSTSTPEHPAIGKPAGAAGGGAEERAFAIAGDVGGLDIGVEIALQRWVGRHGMLLAALLAAPHSPLLAGRVAVLDANGGDGGDRPLDAGRGVGWDDLADDESVEQLFSQFFIPLC
jgi:hypothetical protein